MTANQADVVARHFRARFKRRDASQDTVDGLAMYLGRRARQTLGSDAGAVQTFRPDKAARALLSQISGSVTVPAELLVDAAVAYPTFPGWMGSVITAQVALDPSVLEALSRQVLEPLSAQLAIAQPARALGATTFALLALARSHDYLALRLAKLPAFFDQVKAAYQAASGTRDREEIKHKSHLLLLLHTVLSALPQTEREWKIVTLADEGDEGRAKTVKTPLVEASLVQDYKLFFLDQRDGPGMDDQVLQALRDIATADAGGATLNAMPLTKGDFDEVGKPGPVDRAGPVIDQFSLPVGDRTSQFTLPANPASPTARSAFTPGLREPTSSRTHRSTHKRSALPDSP